MALRKHSQLLPSVFQTTKNQKFLNATIDQLNSEQNNVRINQYIGRKTSKSFAKGDSYITESSADRQNYQLEPAVVYRDSAGNIETVDGVVDYINSIKFNNGNVNNQHNLNTQQYYNYQGWVDIDKMINYGEYFWLPKGPDVVNVGGSAVDPERAFNVYRNDTSYTFDSDADKNQTIYLARGGEYTFTVDQPGFPFWIQTEIGISGISASQGNVNTREVVGVINNGEDDGVVTFRPPTKDQQNFYVNLPVTSSVDFATDYTWRTLHNQTLQNILDQGGIDGLTSFDGKTLVFANPTNDETEWEQGGLFDSTGFDDDDETFDPTTALTFDQRYSIFQIRIISIGGVDTVTLTSIADIPQFSKVKIKQGVDYGSRELYKNAESKLELIPPITADNDTLYYRDGVTENMFGRIVLVDIGNAQTINVDLDIVGQQDYTAPNGVVFTNGLKIEFDSTVLPVEYQQNTYYIEGVGQSDGICLVPEIDLSTPETFTNSLSEPFDSIGFDAGNYDGTEFAPTDPDYIVMNRACRDNNAWSRYNRWFHKNVIEAAAKYNDFTVTVDYTARARRPIIEYRPGLQLFNHGINSKNPVDLFDITQTDALSNVNGTLGYFSDGIALVPQMRIVFSADTNEDVRKTIYRVDFIDEDGDANTAKIINLVPIETITEDDCLVAKFGTVNQGKMFYFKNSVWNESQQKTQLFQDPLFDVFDGDHNSLSNTTVYPNSTFAGSKLFSYKRNNNIAGDSVLGFGLSYKNFNNIGDIVFDNNFITDTFTYTKPSTSKTTSIIVKSGHVHRTSYNNGSRNIENGWKKIVTESKQFQVIRYEVVDEFYSFEIGCQPDTNNTSTNLKVYVNSKFQEPSKYTVLNQNEKYYVVFDNAVEIDDVVIIKVYSSQISPLGYFEVPVNLENNADNTDFTDLTLGQARNHLIEIGENIPSLSGSILGANNMRDINVGQYAGKILQHSAGAILPLYLLANEKANAIDAIKFSSNEYTRFKNRLIDNLDKLDLDLRDASSSVDTILETMVGSKTNAFPFYYSDMVPWGNQKTTINYTIDNTTERFYEFGTQFDLVDVNQRGVLVYLTNSNLQKQQLIHGRDYTFDTEVAGINIDAAYSLAVNDVVTIVEYTDTDGSFVPPTPSKLGLWPAIEPSVYLEQNFGYEETGTGPYKVYGTLDPEYTQNGQGLLGFAYPLYTTYEAAQAADIALGGAGTGIHIHKFIGTPQLFYMPNTAGAAQHGAQDNASIPYYPGVRTIIRGHDGSRYVGFGDVRDSVIFEYEARVFNNIKTNYSNDLFDWQEVLTGYSRSTQADRKIELDIIRSSYGTWAEKNRIDTTTNDTFSVSNAFTWNYSNSQNKNTGDNWPGGWRGIYTWLYDTETPHLTPWEMLGLYSKPSWWNDRYGQPPYTQGNAVLWEDLRDGKLYSDAISSNFTTLTKYQRPELLDFIPVDQQGSLRPPADFACKDLNVSTANGTWRFGDYAPQETAWRTSSEWPFAAQLLGILRKPAKYFSLLWDANLYQYDSSLDQIVQKNRTYRPNLGDYCLHGVADSAGIVSRREGYNQFIYNNLVYNNYNASDEETRVRNLDLNLCYAVGGYTDKNLLKVVAETATPSTSNNTIFVPDENYGIFLNKSVPLDRVVYSGVRIIVVENGYKITGYDNTNPFFKVVPSKKTSNTQTFSVGQDSGFSVFNDYNPYIVNVAYGTILSTKQQVVDFLNSLQRYYVNKGIIFDNVNGDFIETAKQFVFWSQQGWQPGSVFTVSPLYDKIRINRALTTIDDISQTISLRDINGKPISKTDYKVSRIDNETVIYVNTENTVLASAVINPIQYEHILVLDNETIFNDLIYQPSLGNRQDRVKLVGQKTGSWNGTLHAPGYIVSSDSFDIWQENKSYSKGHYVSFRKKLYVANSDHSGTPVFDYNNWDELPNYRSGLLKNISNRSSQFEGFFDIDTLNVESSVDLAGKGLIGFRNRSWLENLGLDDVSQVKFYQGLLKGKGTSDVINKLINADLTNLNQEINFYEEWGFRVGEYGSNDSNQVVEILVDEANSINNPITIEFLAAGETVENNENLGITSSNLYKTPAGFTKNLWKTRTANTKQNDLNLAGYARLDDVDYTVVDINNISDLDENLADLGRGDKVWVAKDSNNSWNIYRIDETETKVSTISSANGFLNIKLDANHNLSKDDIVLIKSNDFYGGVYVIESIQSNTSFRIASDIEIPEEILEVESVPVYKFVSNRFTNLKDLSSYTPLYGFFANEMVWVDSDENGRWAAYEKKLPWNQNDVITSSDIAAAGHMGKSVSIAKDSAIALVGAPESNEGRVIHYKIDSATDRLVEASVKKVVTKTTVDEFGYSVSSADVWHAVGAPATNSSSGAVFLYTRDSNNDLTLAQILGRNSAGRFGHSIAISNNEKYMAVGSPSRSSNTGMVHVYGYNTVDPTNEKTVTINGTGTATYALGFTPATTDSILVVDDQGTYYIPRIDFNVSGSNIVFTSNFNSPRVATVTQKSYWSPVESITGSNSNTGDQFGHSVDIDAEGRTIVVGAPYADIADSTSTVYTDAGEVYVYNNTVEAFVANGTQTTVTTTNSIDDGVVVTVDGTEFFNVTANKLSFATAASEINHFSYSGNTITFSYAPDANSIIRVWTGNYKQTQRIDQNIVSESPTAEENFGFGVAINTYGSSIAIGSPGEDETNPNTGSVFVFTDTGLRFGTVNTETTLHSLDYFENETIFIDDFEVTASADDTDIQQFISDITTANIAGVSATNRNLVAHQATISSTATTPNARLRIRPGTGAMYNKVAVTPFVLTQKINHPSLFENENFGKTVAFDKHINANGVSTQNLMVSSDRSSTLLPVGFDVITDTIDPDYNTYATTFDSDGTLFIDKETQSGAAYVYEFVSAPNESISNYPQHLFQQQLTADEIDELDEFGSSIAINNKRILVGSRLDDQLATDAGSVYEFNTSTGIGWVKKRTQADKVDIDLMNRVVTYNTKEEEIITFCDYIDPYKLKVAGVAQQEIDYFTDFDPASYSTATDNRVQLAPNSPWNDEHVGRVWWDLSTAFFLEYEQGELDYRTQYWGRLFPGATIDVYEWIESETPPAQYTGEGIPKSITEFSTAQQVNPSTNTVQTMYYFFVKGKESIPDLEFRSVSTAAVARAIENPTARNLKHVQFIAPNAFNLVNLTNDLDADKTAISINYDRVANDGILHSEFELVSKGDAAQAIPSRIYDKIVDSCAGVDKAGNAVPTAGLSVAERYGISIRPRQTLFQNRFKAIQVFVDYCNQQFVSFPVVRQANINNFLLADDPQPNTASGLWDKKVNSVEERDYLNTALFATGYKILVTSDSTQNGRWSIYTLQSDDTWTRTSTQTYATSEQWSYKDWYAPGFNEFTVALYQVNTEADLATLTNASAGELAKVLSNDDGNTSSYELQSDGTWREVIIGNGTVEFNTTLYTDYNSESTDFPSNEMRNLFSAVKNDIFIADNALLMNNLFFRMVEYSLDEYGTVHPDWVFKTSFIRVLHKLRDLAQYPTFRNDNSEFVETFINEVKPYKTKIRDYTTSFAGDDSFAGDVTDFDTHAFYDEDLSLFRKPSGDYAGDEVTRTTGLNVPWSQNYTYYINEIEIYNSGSGYIVEPTLTISAPDVEGGTQATATAVSNGSAIIAVNMINKGSGYTTIPTITITGAAGTDLKLVPRLKNDSIREFDVTLKFDRITYSATVKDWTANTAYDYLDLVAYKNTNTGIQEVYSVISASGFTSGATFSAETANGTTALEIYADASLANNADRIAAYYTPTSGMIGDNLNLLQIGTDYTGNRVIGAGFDQAPGFDSGAFDVSAYDAFEIDLDGLEVLSGNLIDTNIRSTYTDSLIGTRPEDIDIDGGKFVDTYNSHAPEEVVPGRVFDTLDIEVYTDPSDDFEYDGNGFNIVTRAYVGDGSTTTFSFRKLMAGEDVDNVLVWVGTQRQYNATVNRTAGTITLNSAPAAGVAIYTYGYGLTGEKITHEQTFTGDGTTNFIVMGIGLSQVVQEFVIKNGVKLVKDTDYVISESDNRTIITLTATPALNDHIHVLTSRQDASRYAFTETYTQAITLTSGVQTYNLDKTIEYVWPYEGAVVAELDNLRLRPTNAKHYTADGSTVTYSIPTSAGEGAITDGDIRVSVISPDDRSTLFPTVNKSVNIDYTVDPSDGSSARNITFYDPPSTGDTVIISVRTGAEYLVDGTTITLTSAAPSYTTGDVLYLTSFSNHNPIRPQTQVFVGLGSDTVTDDELFDESAFDSTGFDETSIAGVSISKYTLDRAVTNNSYLWVTLDGVKLHPGEYDIDDQGRLDMSSQTVTSVSEIIVTSFTENTIQPTVGFRIFKDMLGGYNYYRICDDESTLVTQDVSITDDKIYVEDASKLSDVTPNSLYPGVVFIGNERVTYWERNTTLNYITNLRRATRGTRYAPIHRAGVAVIDASEDSRMPATDTHTKTWYDGGTGTPANGLGIQASTTVNAKYLKSCTAIVQNYTKELDSPQFVADGYVEDGYIEEQLI